MAFVAAIWDRGGARSEYPREKVQNLQREVRDLLASGLLFPEEVV
jgi:hypothetical protein